MLIRASRTALDAAALAALADPALHGAALDRVLARLTPVSSPHAPKPLFDAAQAAAAVRGAPVPALPALPDHPDDLLDYGDAAALFPAGLSPASWDQYTRREPVLRASKTLVLGVPHHRRADIEAWRDARPRRGRGRGRPAGSRDAAARPSAVRDGRELAQDLNARAIDGAGRLTGAVLAEHLGTSERTAQRVLREVRGPAHAPARAEATQHDGSGRAARRRQRLAEAAEALRADPALTGRALAEAIGVPQRTAYRLLRELRAQH
jgi:hypothetical protein